jgi:hypothetical protein
VVCAPKSARHVEPVDDNAVSQALSGPHELLLLGSQSSAHEPAAGSKRRTQFPTTGLWGLSALSECGFLRLAGMVRRTMTQSRWKKTPRCASGRLSPHVFHGNLNHDSQEHKSHHTKQQFLRPYRITHHVMLVSRGQGIANYSGINKGILTLTCLRKTCD